MNVNENEKINNNLPKIHPNLALDIRKKYFAILNKLNNYDIYRRDKEDKFETNWLNYIKNMGFQLFRSLISIYGIVLYVYGTYYLDEKNFLENSPRLTFINTSEIIVGVSITFDLIISYYYSKRKSKFFLKILKIVDILIVIPIFLSFFLAGAQNLNFLIIFRLNSVIKILRLVKLFQVKKLLLTENKTEPYKFLGSVINIISIIFILTGITHYLVTLHPNIFPMANNNQYQLKCSNQGDYVNYYLNMTKSSFSINQSCQSGKLNAVQTPFYFHTSFYFIVITITTTGYGDIYPETSPGRMLTAIIILVALIFFSLNSNDLNSVFTMDLRGEKKITSRNHVIIIGKITKEFLVNFINEFFYHQIYERKDIVIVCDEDPKTEIQFVLMDPNYLNRLHLVILDEINNDKIVDIINLKNAESIILISDPIEKYNSEYFSTKKSQSPDTFLSVSSKFFSIHTNKTKIFCGFSESKSLLHTWAHWDYAYSLEQIKMRISQKNCEIPGYATLISNLLDSVFLFSSNKSFDDFPWIYEYVNGASNSFFVFKMSHSFFEEELKRESHARNEGEIEYWRCLDYNRLVAKFSLEHDILIVGVKTTKINSKVIDIELPLVLVNAFGYKIRENDEIIIITNDYLKASKIFQSEVVEILQDRNATYSKRHSIEFVRFDTPIIARIQDENSILKKKNYFKITGGVDNELLPYLNQHLILICPGSSLQEFMVNHPYSFEEDYIFYLVDSNSSGASQTRKFFKKLIYLEISFSNVEDFKKIRISKARHLFIYSFKANDLSGTDSGLLPVVKLIEDNFPKIPITIQLEDENNLKYLNNYFEKQTDTKFEELLTQVKKESLLNKFEKIPLKMWPKFAKSEIFFSTLLSKLPALFATQPFLIEVLSKFLGYYNKNNIYNNEDRLSPEEFDEVTDIYLLEMHSQDNYTFGDLCNEFFKSDNFALPFAVYRHQNHPILKNQENYIVTNPRKDFILNKLDKILVFAKKSKFLKASDEELILEKHSTKKIKSDVWNRDDEGSNDNLESRLIQKLENEFLDLKIFNSENFDLKNLLYKDTLNSIRETREKEKNKESFGFKRFQTTNEITTTKFSTKPSKVAEKRRRSFEAKPLEMIFEIDIQNDEEQEEEVKEQVNFGLKKNLTLRDRTPQKYEKKKSSVIHALKRLKRESSSEFI